jgi:hypothetical protein
MSQTLTATELVEFSEVIDRPPRAKLHIKESPSLSEDVANVDSSDNAVPEGYYVDRTFYDSVCHRD